MELILIILLTSVLVQAFESIGSTWFVNLLYSNSSSSSSSKAIKKEVLELRSQLSTINSQNEFAKWAKLTRRLDKLLLELKEMNIQSSSAKSAFSTKIKSLLWIMTTIVPFVVSSWHRKQPVFYVPANSLSPITRFLSLPSAPSGAIACGIWTMVCKRFIGAIKSIFVDFKDGGDGTAVPLTEAAASEQVVSDVKASVKHQGKKDVPVSASKKEL